jgi:ABC-type phosphate transport system substrate-binding protein
MSRHALMLGLSMAALSTASLAQPAVINGGGAASQKFEYAAGDVNNAAVSEFSLFNAQQTSVAFGTYWSTTSGVAQTGLINDDLTCLINQVQSGTGCSGTPGGADTVHYAVSESVLSPATISSWATSSFGQSAAGDLIQIPALGTGLAIVVNDPGVTTNGQVGFSDNDLCGIFSGLITNFNQITDSPHKPPAGAISLVYRSDSAGTTFLLTNHLAAVCNSSNTAAGVTFSATSNFSSLFASPITNQIPGAVGVSGLAVLANTLAGLAPPSLPQAVSYISPDWTSVDSATSSAKLSNGQPSPLLVASLKNGKLFFLPTTTYIRAALTHVVLGTNPTPPTNATDAANPAKWVPTVQTVSTGYPIDGYSALDFPQCYASKAIKNGMIAFLKLHYTNTSYLKIQQNNGLVAVANSGAAKFVDAILRDILANEDGWGTNLGHAAACAGKVGR